MEMTAERLTEELCYFTGTEKWHRHSLSRCLYTDGIKYLAEKADAYWLIDAVLSYQKKLKNINFQLWNLKKEKGNSFILTCREDKNSPVLISQKIKFSDFILEKFEFYCITGIMLLKSEN